MKNCRISTIFFPEVVVALSNKVSKQPKSISHCQGNQEYRHGITFMSSFIKYNQDRDVPNKSRETQESCEICLTISLQ